MKIVVFGASGRSGRKIAEQALQKGWHVKAYVRNKAKLPIEHAHLSFIEGDVYEDEKVFAAVEGVDAVVSALGQSDISGEVNLMSDGMKRILPAMQRHNVKRVIAIGGMGALQASPE
ncbi:MAG: NAD(P)H-binding protein, partial [Chitinophagales bacterium]|nr:NAD(P)H-binding protein [Chitinophagales bacterium]